MPKSLFISHGAPDLVIAGTKATEFLKDYGRRWKTDSKPDAIVMVSAHFETDLPTIVADPQPDMIYDFGGFDPVLRTLTYPAPGSPEIAGRVAEALQNANIEHAVMEKRGFDHGVWVPLMLMLPDAEIPVVQLSVQPNRDAAWHIELGRALAPLTEDNILVVGSGSLTHNLSELFQNGLPARDSTMPEWVEQFADWTHAKLAENDFEALSNYRERAPHAARNHPTEEHLHPLFVAMAAAGGHSNEKDLNADRIHASAEFGVLAMDAYAFD